MSDITLPGRTRSDGDDASYADRLDSLEEKTLVFVDWGKPNGPELYERFEPKFVDEFGIAALEYFKKPSPSSPMPGDLLEEILAVEPDGVILAIADCGSCNSSSVVDAKTFEERNIPTIQVITDAFLDLNGTISASYGYEDLPLVAVEHPTRYLDPGEVDDLATEIMGAVRAALTSAEPPDTDIQAPERA